MTTAESFQRRSRLPWVARIAILFLGLFVIGDVCIALTIWLPYRREQQIISAVQGWGGKTASGSTEAEWLGADLIWIKSVKGLERSEVFDRTIEVWCSGAALTDADVLRLTELKRLKRLGLSKTPIGDKALLHLCRMGNLEYLYLDKTRITDAGLAHLGRLTTLRQLSLADTAIGDNGVASLSDLKNLEMLWIKRTQISDAGLAVLKTALPDCHIER